MTATMIRANAEGIRRSHRDREEKNRLSNGYKAVMVKNGELFDLVDLRIAFSDGGTCYACVWVHTPAILGENGKVSRDGLWNAGSGSAGGYGYHKASAAAQEAFERAGFQLSENINGRGDTATRDAVLAVGNCVAPGDAAVYVVEMHP